ncbi:MAG: cell division protein FtsZ [Opitutales bacterium]
MSQSENEIPSEEEVFPELKFKVVGVGGAGNNAVDRLHLAGRLPLPLANLNTDQKSLLTSPVEEKVLLGRTTTGGLSAGYDAEVGRRAAEEALPALEKVLEGQDLVFLVAGLGGGTGSGAAPLVAELAAELGAVVVAFVTLPFSREGARNTKRADDALSALRTHCHAVIPLPNDLLVQEIDESATLLDAFQLADDWIGRGVHAIWSMLSQDGLINVDFATLRDAFSMRGGKTLFGIGVGEGPDAVSEALRQLDLCPLLHLPENRYVRKTESLIVHVAGGPDLTMVKVNEILDFATDRFGSKEQTVLGAVIDGSKNGRVEITVVGTAALDRGTRHAVAPARSSLSRLREQRREAVAQQAAKERAASSSAAAHEPGAAADEPRKSRWITEEPVSPASDHRPFPPAAATSSASASSSENARRPARGRDQSEFDFPRAEDNRGYFEKTSRNTYEGDDLDVPTYLRRGLKIALH